MVARTLCRPTAQRRIRWRGRVPARVRVRRAARVGCGRIGGDDRRPRRLGLLGRRDQRVGHRVVAGQRPTSPTWIMTRHLRECAGDVTNGSVDDLEVTTGDLLQRRRQRLDQVRRIGVGGEGDLQRRDHLLVGQVTRHGAADVGRRGSRLGPRKVRTRDFSIGGAIVPSGPTGAVKTRSGLLSSPVTTPSAASPRQSQCASVTLPETTNGESRHHRARP